MSFITPVQPLTVDNPNGDPFDWEDEETDDQ